jgi:FKBP-type peptidyl-prolyl cis-trans isomerase SlyD
MSVIKIQDGVVVSLAYVLIVDGEEIERVDPSEPLDYLHGAENIVPGLETALNGKKVGDSLSVTVSPEQGYGHYEEDDIETISRKDIPGAETLKVGMTVELEDEEGYLYDAVVKEVNRDSVVLDFNPPLAGKTLRYDVQVVALREADDEEMAHGHPHSMFSDEDFEDEDDEQ